MKNFVLMICMVLLASCGFGEVETGVNSGSDGIWRGPSYGKYLSGTVYASGLDYPEAYDWRGDPKKGEVKCSVVMFADGIPVLKVPVGDRWEVSSDASRHRIRGGCLYTDFTDGWTTVIKKDGLEAVRYKGAEEIACLEVHEGHIHTLGCPKADGGFVYRIDGESVVARDSGSILSRLSVCGGKTCFCFSIAQADSTSRYYMVSDGKVSLVELEEDVTEVLDMEIYGNQLYVLANTASVKGPVMISADKRRHVSYFSTLDILSCRFMDTDSLCVRIRHRKSDSVSDILWFGDPRYRRFIKGGMVEAISRTGNGYHAAVYSPELRKGSVYSGDRKHDIDADCYFYGDKCLTVRDSLAIVALASGSSGRPIIWHDGMLDTLDINGPLTCLR